MKNNSKYSLVTLLLLLVTLSVNATGFTVNSLADSNTGAGTSGTLRWCMNQANLSAGPHTITFDAATSGGTINLTSNLPIVGVPNVTIDGIGDGSGNITIDANGGDIVRSIFRANATGDFAAFKNFILQDTGLEPFRFDGNPTDITIENIVTLHNGGNYLNYAVLYNGNAVGLTIKNFKMSNQQNYGGGSIYITGTSNNVLIDDFDLSDSGGGDIRAITINGVANNVTIQNCDIDLDLAGSGNDGNIGIYFGSASSNITLNDNTLTNIDSYSLIFNSTCTNVTINNFQYINGVGGTTAMGMRFVGVASNINMSGVILDLDHTGTTDDGDYGIYFNTTTSNVTLDNLTIHDAERNGVFIGGVATDIEITNSTFDNFDGWTGNQMIWFNSVVNGITMTNVTIDEDFNGSTNDGNYGVYFNSHLNQNTSKNAVFTNVTINQADSHGLYTRLIVNNLTIDDCSFTGNSETNTVNYGIEFDNNNQKKNITITNSTFTNLGSAAILIDMDGTNNTSNNKFTNNTISGTVTSTYPGYGIWLWDRNGITDLEISNNTIFNNASFGIRNEAVDGVLYSQNLFYNNPAGIDNVSNSGNNDLERLDGDTPRLQSSVDIGGGNFDVTFTLPAFCTDCDVEFFTNQAGDARYNGRNYRDVALGLSGVGPHTITVNAGGATDGFWTTTLKSNTLNGSVSEFSGSVVINPKGPANVDAGIALWVRADISGQADGNFTVGNGWLDFSGNENNYDQAINSDPELVSNVINFNHSVVFDGNDWLTQLNTNLNAFPLANDGRTVFIVSNITVTSSESAYSYGRNATNQNQSWRYENGTIRYIGWGNDFTGVGAFTVNEPFISRYDHDGTTASINSDGRQVITSLRTYNTNFSSAGSHIGVRTGAGAEGFIGDISEVIVYNRNLTDPEKDRIESYLALKYGITLDQIVVATDYFASDGTTKVWDATANAAYKNDITGIGRDDDGFFNQKQSKSINTDNIVTIGLGEIAIDNPTNANTFAADKNFLIWGNDNASTTVQTTEMPGTATAVYRMGREWKVAETGAVSNLTMAFANVPSTAYDIELYIDTDGDGDFTNATVITGGTISGGVATFTGVDLNNNDSFTIGFTTASPGGVVAGLNLWLRADLGTTPSTTGTLTNWEDVAQSNNATQFGARPLPSVIDGSATLFNFNKAIEFTATNQKIGNITSTTLGTTNYDIFSFTKEGMSGSRILNIGRNNTILNGLNWDSPGFQPNSVIIQRRVSDGAFLYGSNPGGSFNTTIPSITYNRFTNTSVTKGYNGANTGAVGNYGAIGAPLGGYILGDNRSTGTSGDDQGFIGTVGEFIAYNRNLTTTERRQVDSYMAIKYGLTLDLTVAVNNYLMSDASVIWDATANATYNNDIAGIGKDDLSALNQKQSKSINTDAIVTIGLGSIDATNEANANTFAADKNFLVWGNDSASDNVSIPYTPNSFTPVGNYNRMARIWKIAETGTVATVKLNIPVSYSVSHFIVDTDGDEDFSTGTPTEITMIEDGNGNLTVDYNFSDGDIFTFGNDLIGPGGVFANMNIWLKADENVYTDNFISATDGTPVEFWKDNSSNNNSAVQGAGNIDPDTGIAGTLYSEGSRPTFVENSFNYNPAIGYDGLNGNTTGDWMDFKDLNNNQVVFVVAMRNASAGNDYDHFLYGSDAGNASGNFYHGGYNTFQYNGVNPVPGWRKNGTGASWNTTYTENYPDIIANEYTSNTVKAANMGIQTGYTSRKWSGNIQEVILFNSAITTTERSQIESYLALKYGITLDQSIAQNYIASDASVIWNATANATYKNDIAGIARDDAAGLNQKQSKSVNADGIVTIGLGSIDATNAANVNTFAADKNFLVWGNDNASTATQTTELPGTATAANRLGREWKVAETGSVSNLEISFANIPSSAYDIELFVDTDGDGDFTNASVITGGVVSGGVATFTGVDLNDGDVFTIGYSLRSPGGVFTAETNGATYKLYNAYTISPGIGTAPQMNGTLLSTGYVANFTHVDDVFNNEITGVVGYEIDTEIQIDVAGNYTFRQLIDNSGALWIDNVLQINNACVCTTTSAVIALSVGRHKIKLRSANNGGPGDLRLQYTGPSIAWQNIPDNKLFVSAELGLWLKANAGVTAGGDATTATVWGDQSANGNNVTTTEGTPLFYDTTESEMLNFNPSIDFQDDAMTSADNTNGLAFDKQSRTVFAVATSSTNSGSNYIFSQGRDVTSAHFGMRNYVSNLELIGWSYDINSPGYWTVNQPEIVTGLYENYNINSTNNATLYGKGQLLNQGNKDWRTQLNNNYDFSIGDLVNQNQGFNGHITEVIYYPWNLNATERSKVESYLAIKYGITLEVGVNYIASDATVIWDATANAAYSNDIAGIGYDDISALNQKQSKSVNTDAIVTIGLGSIEATNAANANTFAADKNFLIWGNDNASTGLQTTEMPATAVAVYRLGREWKVEETGAVSNLTITFDNVPSTAYDIELFVDTDGDGNFTNASVITGGIVSGGVATFTGVDLNNNDLFTIGYTAASPGGVLTDLNLWLKADQGTHSDLVTNGDFSSGATGWIATGNVNLDPVMNFNSGNAAPNAVVYQDITTVIGDSYELNFYYNKVGGGGGTVSVQVDVIDVGSSTVLATTTVTASATSTLKTLAFAATGANTRLRFTDVSANTFSIDIHIDNVSVASTLTAVNGDQVPIWEDQSIGNHNASQFTANNQPVFADNGRNFNPSLTFDGTNDRYDLPIGIVDNGNTSYSIISVQTQTATQEAQVLFLGNTATNRGIHHQLDVSDQFESSWPNNGFFAGNPNPNEPDIYTATYNNASGRIMRQDRLQVGTNPSLALNYLQTANVNKVGRFNGINYFNGDINEIIVYNAKTTTGVELQRIESYLAIKYGITLDQGTPTNYLASDASVIWDPTINATYNKDIAGIGRDDLSVLNQKQSKSVNTGAIVTIGLGTIDATNIANLNTFTADKDFLVWGNDNVSTAVVNTGIPSTFSEKIIRNWLVNETGAVGNTLVQIPNSAVAGFSSTTALQLFVADDTGFTTNLVAIPLVQNGANWEATVDFNGVKYFTFGIVASGDFMRHGKTFQGGTEQPMKF